ncbi:MAG: hypothetical protein ABJA16_07665, partial [Nakamurella sp.]
RFRPALIPSGRLGAARAAHADVLIVRRRGDPSVDPLIDDLALGQVVPGGVFVAFDGAGGAVEPAPRAHVAELLTASPSGVGWCRNELLRHLCGDRVLVLGADLRCGPDLLRRLLEVDDAIVHSPVRDEAEGLVGALPMEARRLAALPYLGAGYLVRRRVLDALGGWCSDPWTEGLTDHLFWTAAATASTATLVQRPLLSRTWAAGPRRPLDLDPSRAWRVAADVMTVRPVAAGDAPRAEVPSLGSAVGAYAEMR